MKVELLYIRDCPNAMDYLPELQELLDSVGIDDPVQLQLIEDQDQAVAQRFVGSPTVRIDGVDVDPSTDDRADYAISCRLYRSETGTTGRPPRDWVRQALTRALAAAQAATGQH